MHSLPNRPSRVLQIAALFPLVAFAASAHADIYQWEYIDPADPSRGKQQNTTLAPDGAGVDAVPGANIGARNLTMAYLHGADLSGANFSHPFLPFGSATVLMDADLSAANLTNASFYGATLTNADFTGANVRQAQFGIAPGICGHYACIGPEGTGIALEQLYSTASYQAQDLTGVGLSYNFLNAGNFAAVTLEGADFRNASLVGANFGGASLEQANLTNANLYRVALENASLVGANLTNATLSNATLTDADFANAEIGGASFSRYQGEGTGLTLAQLYATANYQAHNLGGVALNGNDLAGGDFAGQDMSYSVLAGADLSQTDLTNANLFGAYLTDADLTNAQVQGANFSRYVDRGTHIRLSRSGITLAQLYSTASYQAHDLSGINMGGNDLAGANLTAQNLSDTYFGGAVLTDADLTGADIRGANFSTDLRANGDALLSGTGITISQLYSTASYQAHDLNGISLSGNNLSGANFAGQNLTNANIYSYGVVTTIDGADFTGAEIRGATLLGITLAQLYSTASYLAHDLSGIGLPYTNLGSADFAGQNLSNADLVGSTLTGADFGGADVRGASFGQSPGAGRGITPAQLYSTASYQAKDLRGIDLSGNALAGAHFAGQNLEDAKFGGASLSGVDFRAANLANTDFNIFPNGCVLTSPGCGDEPYDTELPGADLTAADARGAVGLGASDATTANLIWPDGHIDGLDLETDGLLVVRDHDGNSLAHPSDPISIFVDRHLMMGPGGTLRLVFEADAWDSTISFAPAIPVALGGTLELTFADDVNLASQVGRTFDLFDWTGVDPTGAFAVSSPYGWDLSNLYTTGEVTLTAVPEPRALFLFCFALAALVAIGRARPSLDSTKGKNQ